jgi:hypothetical protein
VSQTDRVAAFHEWVRGRTELATRLDAGECGGSYGDAVLILSAVLSGFASDAWPGKRKDFSRFVEAWTTLSEPALNAGLISVPLLLSELEKEQEWALIDKVRTSRPDVFAPGNESLVLRGDMVDQAEDDLVALDPGLAAKRLRRFSYGSVFYEHVRSPYTHEYHLLDTASAFPQTRQPAPVGYVNVAKHSDPRTRRRIHFDVAWVGEIVRSVASSLVTDGPIEPRPEPNTWWVHGHV